MPRAVDRTPLQADYDPNRSGTEFHMGGLIKDQTEIWAAILQAAAESMQEAIMAAIQDILGFELGGLGGILEGLSEAIAAGLDGLVRGLLSGGVFVNVLNLIGSLPQQLFSFVPIGAIGHGQPAQFTPFVAGVFADPEAIVGNGIWEWDPSVSRTGDGTGSAMVHADGTFKAMYGHAISMAQGQRFKPRIYVRWDDYSGSGATVELQIKKFNGDTQVGSQTLATFTPTGASGGWSTITGSSYAVEENVTSVRVRLVVTDDANSGVIHFDDGGYQMSSNFVSNLEKWFDIPGIGDFFGDPDTFDPTDMRPVPFKDWIDTFFGALRPDDDIPTGSMSWTDLLNEAINSYRNIKSDYVGGVGGPQDIGATMQETWNKWVSGLVGADGDDASLADLRNLGQIFSSRATKGQLSFDILGIRANKSLDTGFLPTSESPIALSSLAFGSSAPTFNVTQSASTIEFHRFNESGPFGVIGWQGSGNASLTAFYVNIWKMDTTTGDLELVHRSPNILGDISATLAAHVYEFTDADIMREPGDVFGAELTVVGAGSHAVVGAESWVPDQPVFPRRYAATRNSGTGSPPSTIASGSVTYSSNVPFIEFGVDAGSTPVPHAPDPLYFSTPGEETTPVQSWANFYDLIGFGAGGGGQNALFAVPGSGGRAGAKDSVTLEVGVDIKPGTLITVDVGQRGGANSTGGTTTISWVDMSDAVQTLTCAGGASVGGSGRFGQAAGDEIVNGETYRGGGASALNGAAPGGGGAGGNPYGAGYLGAHGGAWVVARQS